MTETDVGGVDRVGGVLGALLERSHELPPDALPEAVAEAGDSLGGRDVGIWLADLAQEVLVAWDGRGDRQEIDATVAGRCYRTSQPLATADGESFRLWVPLLDGTDRLGVLGALVDDDTPATTEAWMRLASLVAELVITRSHYGDAVHRVRRVQPMTLASELRWAILPPRSYVCNRVAIAAVVEPTYSVAGDSFDYAVNGDVAHVAVFDAMGHGIEASRVANLAMAGYRFARRGGAGLVETHQLIDEAVADQFGEATFVTGALAELELQTGRLRHLIVGHPRPLLLRQGRMVGTLDAHPALPFGIGDREPAVAETSLEPGDRVLLYTDGVVEARSADGEPFGVDRLADFLVRADAGEEPAAETLRRLSASVRAHRGVELLDDATMLLVEWRASR